MISSRRNHVVSGTQFPHKIEIFHFHNIKKQQQQQQQQHHHRQRSWKCEVVRVNFVPSHLSDRRYVTTGKLYPVGRFLHSVKVLTFAVEQIINVKNWSQKSTHQSVDSISSFFDS